MTLDLAWDDSQLAVADGLDQFARERCDDDAAKASAGTFPQSLWREVAELGVLALCTPEGDGGPREVAAAMESLGRAVFPGPLVATLFATQVLPATERQAVASGACIVSIGGPPVLPWAPHADCFIEVDGRRAWLATPTGGAIPEPVATLGGEPWGRVWLDRGVELAGVVDALALADMARAAYLAAAGQRLVDDASAYARTRTQFGRAIGEFQALAHPLADCHMRLSAAATLARAAACEIESRGSRANVLASAARLSAAAAGLEAAYACHQAFGAVGITLEGPAFHVTRRIRQLASQPPGEMPARDALLTHFGLAPSGSPEAGS